MFQRQLVPNAGVVTPCARRRRLGIPTLKPTRKCACVCLCIPTCKLSTTTGAKRSARTSPPPSQGDEMPRYDSAAFREEIDNSRRANSCSRRYSGPLFRTAGAAQPTQASVTLATFPNKQLFAWLNAQSELTSTTAIAAFPVGV